MTARICLLGFGEVGQTLAADLRARVDGITVAWPDGVREAFPGTAADRLVTLRQGTGQQAR